MSFFKSLSIVLFAFTVLVFSSTGAFAYHTHYNGLLKAYASPAEKDDINYIGIDYQAWAADPRHEKAMLSLLDTNPDTLKSMAAKKAFWLNAYNLLTIDMITRTGEQETIKNQGDALKGPGSTYKWKIGKNEYTLNQIKDDIIRPMGDPRMNFAMNMGSISCPDIRREAYTAARIDGQLRDQVLVSFQNETKGVKFKDNTVRVPQYMEWVSKDFKNGDIKAWLQGYYPQYIDAETQLGFFQHNWKLNNRPQKSAVK
tara:strand:+ start:512 stop:1279 length:768 start_codon:yes stop_codon:yes gene_type:complete